MRAKIAGAVFIFIFCQLTIFGQTWNIEWEKTMGTPNMDMFTDIVQNPEGGFTVVGSTFLTDKPDMDFWLVKFTLWGDIIWEKTFGTDNNDFPECVAQCNDGGYILTGKTQSEGDYYKAFLLKTDKDGVKQWQKVLEKLECATNVIVTDDGEFVIAGTKLVDGAKNIWLAKFRDEGEQVWMQSFGENNIALPGALKKLPDGGFVLAGQISEKGSGDADLWVSRFNRSGKKIWDNRIKSPGISVWPNCVCCSPDSNIVTVGWYGTCMNDIKSAEPIFDFDLFVTEISPEGKLLWTKNIDSEGSEGGNAVVVRPDGKILMAGKKETSFLGRIGPWLLLADDKGNVLSELVLPFIFNDNQASGIINTSDGGFVVIGPGQINPDKTRSDGWIKKFKAF